MRSVAPLVADFETTALLNYEKEGQVRVWHWCLVSTENINVVAKGYDILSFFEYCSQLKTITIYFHNLGFDLSFILDSLFKNGFSHSSNKKLLKGEFNTLIDDLGKVYSCKVRFNDKSTVTFYDSFKLFLTSVDGVAKGFGLPLSKGSIDYKKYRPIDYVPTKEEEEYIENDCKIIAYALKSFLELGLNKSTLAGNALQFYKLQFGLDRFKLYFPELTLEEDAFIRNSYKGGFVSVNEKYRNKTLKNVQIYDVKSLYPSVMKNIGNDGLPCCRPRYFEGEYQFDKKYPLYIQHIRIIFELKRGYIPIIQIKRSFMFNDREYIKTSNGMTVDMYVTNVDLELIKEFYNIIYIEYIDGYKFKRRKRLFDSYVDYWYEKKRTAELEGNGSMRQIAKIFMNGLSGKFGSKTQRRGKIPFLGEDDVVHFEKDTMRECKPVYTAVISFITAYARQVTIKTILKYLKVGGCDKDRWVYSDTDSIHLLAEDDKPICKTGNQLGDWEYIPSKDFCTEAKYIRAKTYIYTNNGKNIVKCAGLPKPKGEITLDGFSEGAVFTDSKLRVKRVQGGIMLLPTDFTLKTKHKI